MRFIILAILIFGHMNLYAQLETVEKRLLELGIEEDFLTQNLKDSDAEHSFNLKTINISSTEKKVERARFDPTKPIGEKWILVDVNGQAPTKKELKQFDKAHNTKKEDINGEVDDSSWKIVQDDDNYLAISYHLDPKTLPTKYRFLASCVGTAYINKKSKKLERAEYINNAPLKIKIFNVTKLDMKVYFQYNVDEETYFITTEEIDMVVKMLGQEVEILEKNEFSDYKKI